MSAPGGCQVERRFKALPCFSEAVSVFYLVSASDKQDTVALFQTNQYLNIDP